MGINKSVNLQQQILDLYIQTTQRMIDEWDRELLFLHMKKQTITDDIKRFETNFQTWGNFLKTLKPPRQEGTIELKTIEGLFWLSDATNDQELDWKRLLTPENCDKAHGLFLLYEKMGDASRGECLVCANPDVYEHLYTQAQGVSLQACFKAESTQWQTVGEWIEQV